MHILSFGSFAKALLQGEQSQNGWFWVNKNWPVASPDSLEWEPLLNTALWEQKAQELKQFKSDFFEVGS